MKYVFLNIRDKYVECVKTNSESSKIEVLKYEYKKETIIDFIEFINKTIVIGYDLSDFLIQLLTDMYELNIYDCVFRYYDMKDFNDNNKNYRVFRGLNYNLYLINNGYYVYDKSDNKKASYYIHKKELGKDGEFNQDEYLYIKINGGNFITNIFHISDSTVKYTNEYTIYSDNDLNKYKYMIDKMSKSLEFIKEHPDLNIKLICIGKIDELKENYKILGKDKLDLILKLIVREKELWSNW